MAIMVPYTREDEKDKVSAGESEYADIEAAGADGEGAFAVKIGAAATGAGHGSLVT